MADPLGHGLYPFDELNLVSRVVLVKVVESIGQLEDDPVIFDR